MRFLIIANPAAGRGRGARLAAGVDERLRRAGAESHVAFTVSRGEAERIACESDASCIVSCGGDGTVQEVVNGLLRDGRTTARLGLAPCGRCNDFAGAFGIRSDADQIASVLLGGRVQAVDLGRVNARYFCTVAALGFDAAVSRYVNELALPLKGTLAYLYGTVRMLLCYEPVSVRVTCNGQTREQRVFLLASANTPSYGGRMRIAPGADACDGQFEVCIVDVVSRWKVLRMIPRVLRGEHTTLDEVHMLQTASLRIDAAEPLELWADGEPVARTPATVEVVPAAIEMFVPGDANPASIRVPHGSSHGPPNPRIVA